MQINELDTSTPSTADYLALDDGSNTYKTTVQDMVDAATNKNLIATFSSFSSLPQSLTVSGVTSDYVVLEATLGTPSAQTGDWTVTTATDTVTVSGDISGSTTLTLILGYAS